MLYVIHYSVLKLSYQTKGLKNNEKNRFLFTVFLNSAPHY